MVVLLSKCAALNAIRADETSAEESGVNRQPWRTNPYTLDESYTERSKKTMTQIQGSNTERWEA
jgi:hypothetical protein